MKNLTIGQLLEEYPFVTDFFQQNLLDVGGFEHLTLTEYLSAISAAAAEENAIDITRLPAELDIYIEQMKMFLGLEPDRRVNSLTILPGTDKTGAAERFKRLDICPSQIISIVGPTGSGKSRLLADIEWAAQGDTPTGRRILINETSPDPRWRYSPNHKLVAQLSQNMNFVIDLSVGEFLHMHAESRMVNNADQVVKRILDGANELAGEAFQADTPVTSLSGGQSRALMISDTAILSASPIVLIDEIENAGIDRKKALDILVSQDKIVLMATHDPLLALMADRRIVIQRGGIYDIIETSAEEKQFLTKLEQMDAMMQESRRLLRSGKAVTGIAGWPILPEE